MDYESAPLEGNVMAVHLIDTDQVDVYDEEDGDEVR